MELALYHPELGYYTSRHQNIGISGDFFTSVSVGPLFGQILARQFLLWREQFDDFTVYELGGHRGQLRADVLAAAPGLDYRVIEVGDALPERISGCVFSNEFFDALPVHRVCGSCELYVDGNFTEQPGPLSDPRLPRLPEGYQTEINLKATEWMTEIARLLERGYALTIDYGFERAEYFAPHHSQGHLQCYYRHTRNTDPFLHIGEQDITAHVDFSSLMETGTQHGLKTVLFTDQAHFLLEIGEPIIREIVERTAGKPSKERQSIHQLTHPGLMGRAFKVLIQKKIEP